jgi:hypothetical protein
MVLMGDIDDAVDVAEVGKVDGPRDTETQRGRREEEEVEEAFGFRRGRET